MELKTSLVHDLAQTRHETVDDVCGWWPALPTERFILLSATPRLVSYLQVLFRRRILKDVLFGSITIGPT